MVLFRLRENILNETSTAKDGNRNISVVNITHILVLDVLLPETYRVIATNRFGSAQSSIGTFMTLLKQQGYISPFSFLLKLCEDLNCDS